MIIDHLAALAGFALVSTISPGPNNVMLMASGANFGVLRSLPHMLGVAWGFALMVFVVGAGLAQIFDLWPASRLILKGVSLAYLLWLSWKLTRASAPGSAGATARPLSWLQAAAFQWVNPKAWAMALSANGVYAAGAGLGPVAVVAAVFAMVALVSVIAWVVLGREIRRFLDTPRRLSAFNWTMAALMLASLWPLIA